MLVNGLLLDDELLLSTEENELATLEERLLLLDEVPDELVLVAVSNVLVMRALEKFDPLPFESIARTLYV
ncbi:hypothetical protein B0D95_15935 [Cellvibrio sp. PSBB023]|nr:hypothetical protein B0D95_15935 [Cellvibrio sp. PSBB023]